MLVTEEDFNELKNGLSFLEVMYNDGVFIEINTNRLHNKWVIRGGYYLEEEEVLLFETIKSLEVKDITFTKVNNVLQEISDKLESYLTKLSNEIRNSLLGFL